MGRPKKKVERTHTMQEPSPPTPPFSFHLLCCEELQAHPFNTEISLIHGHAHSQNIHMHARTHLISSPNVHSC
ncbi:hypothetical protein AMELA_G00191240 [Ameiurus melas]|uniref:Uncharacterized protein n=1 Tax=Ameiurus melas TaxID=219545 RepID=A0A7J6ABY0_AMEME|nr:hypothetical protein AMELA_G00191240 [Ameiurus melas]